MVRPGQEVGTETAGIDLLQVQLCSWCDAQCLPGPCLINGLAICLGSEGDVLTVFVASLDLEAHHADAYQFRHLMQGIQVSGGEQVAIRSQVAWLPID
jgi:hypothetical protein